MPILCKCSVVFAYLVFIKIPTKSFATSVENFKFRFAALFSQFQFLQDRWRAKFQPSMLLCKASEWRAKFLQAPGKGSTLFINVYKYSFIQKGLCIWKIRKEYFLLQCYIFQGRYGWKQSKDCFQHHELNVFLWNIFLSILPFHLSFSSMLFKLSYFNYSIKAQYKGQTDYYSSTILGFLD